MTPNHQATPYPQPLDTKNQSEDQRRRTARVLSLVAPLTAACLFVAGCGDDSDGVSVDAGAGGDGGTGGRDGGTGGRDAGTGGDVASDTGVAPVRGLLAADSFDYIGGISGADGGQGFAEAWSGGGSIATTGLTYSAAGSTLDTSGFAVEIDGTSSSRQLDLSNVAPEFSSIPNKLGAIGTSIWISLLARSETPIPPSGFGGLQLFDGDNEQRFVGAPFFTNDPARKQTWGLDRPGNPTPIYSEVPVTQLSLLLVRIDFGADIGEAQPGSRMSLWVNPAMGEPEKLGEASAILDGPDFRFDTVRLNGHYSGFLIDEVRVGTDFESVLPNAVGPETAFVHEAFDYDAATDLFGYHGGSGFEGGWSSPNGANSKLEAAADSLNYVDGSGVRLATSGGAVAFGSGPPGGRRIVARGLPSVWSDTAGSWGAPGSQMWISYVAQLDAPIAPDGRFGGLTLHENGFNDPTQQMFIGAPYYNDEEGRLPNWGFDRPGLTQPSYTDVAISTEPTLLVAKVLFQDDGTTVQVWVAPELGDETQLPPPDLEVEHPGFRFNAVGFNSNIEGFKADEVRIGPSFTSVTPAES